MSDLVPDPAYHRHDGWTPEKRRVFLDALRDSASVTAAARAVGLSTTSAYRLRMRDAAFAERWELVLSDATDELEAILRQRAIEGVERPIVRGDKVVATYRQYSDRLAMHLLTMRRSGRYGGMARAEPPARGSGEKGRLEIVRRLRAIYDRRVELGEIVPSPEDEEWFATMSRPSGPAPD